MKIIPENEVDEAAVEYSEKVNGPNYNELYPNCDETLGEVTIKEFKAGVTFAESKVHEYIKDIIIENQGLKLYKDNEAKRFAELAIEFANFIGDNYFEQTQNLIWFTELLHYSGCVYTTKELFNNFLKERNGKI